LAVEAAVAHREMPEVHLMNIDVAVAVEPESF
jgi:hypothetical protein